MPDRGCQCRLGDHLWVISGDVEDLCNDFLPKVLVHQSSTGQLGVEACATDID